MDDATRTARARTFGNVASEYDAVRPGYPPALFKDVIEFAGVEEGSSILEIGCGTGQATHTLAALSSVMTCLEHSSALSGFARQKFRSCEGVRIITSRFEDAHLPSKSFDLIFAATAFHWVDPEVRFTKSAELLRQGGTLAIFANIHPRPFTRFFAEVQRFYGELGSEWRDPETSRTTGDHNSASIRALIGEPSFSDAVTKLYKWCRDYTAEEYSRLLATYSDHVRLGPAKLGTLQANVRRLIESEYDGTVSRPYETLLCMARRI